MTLPSSSSRGKRSAAGKVYLKRYNEDDWDSSSWSDSESSSEESESDSDSDEEMNKRQEDEEEEEEDEERLTELSSFFPSLLLSTSNTDDNSSNNNNNKIGFHFPLLEHLELTIDGPFVNVLEAMLRLVLAGCPRLIKCYIQKYKKERFHTISPCKVGRYAQWQGFATSADNRRGERQNLDSESISRGFGMTGRSGGVKDQEVGYINLPSFEALPIHAKGLEDLAIKAEGGKWWRKVNNSIIAPQVTARTLSMSLMSQLSSVCDGLRHLFLSHVDIKPVSLNDAAVNFSSSFGLHRDTASPKRLQFPNLVTATLLDSYFGSDTCLEMLCPMLAQLDMTVSNRPNMNLEFDNVVSSFRHCENVRTLRLYVSNTQYGRPAFPIKWENVTYPPHLDEVVVTSYPSSLFHKKFLNPLARDSGNHLRRLILLADE